ncbi:hypothetical protein LTR56_027155 [Elasticomyces elasticus]|nr:hypothetical protein LTR56_027155 [Elasticomyces elasticus]KAK3623319.1 hypothetical protein LTR22_024430 [Elasticomyces elasticus]
MASVSSPNRVAKRRSSATGTRRMSERQRSKLAEQASSSIREDLDEDCEMAGSQESIDAKPQLEGPGRNTVTDSDVNTFPLMKLPAEIRNEIYRACLTRPFIVLLSRKEPPPPEPKTGDDGTQASSDTEEEDEIVVRSVAAAVDQASVTPTSTTAFGAVSSGNRGWASRTSRPIRVTTNSFGGANGSTQIQGSAPSQSNRSSQRQARVAQKLELPRVARPQDEDPLLVNLLQCSKTVYQEARSILYSENVFTLDLDTALPTLAALHQRSRRQIKHVELEIPCYNEILERFQETVRLSLRYCWGLKKFVIHMPFTLPGADGSGTTGNTTVYANGFDILRWLPKTCEVVLSGKTCKEIEQVVSKNATLAKTLDEVSSAKLRKHGSFAFIRPNFLGGQ